MLKGNCQKKNLTTCERKFSSHKLAVIFFNIKYWQNRIKLNSVRSLWLCEEKNRPFGMSCPLRIETKMKKTKVSEAAIGGVL